MSTVEQSGLAGIPGGTAPEDVPQLRRARRAELVRGLLHSKTFMIGVAIVTVWVISALTWRWITPVRPAGVDPVDTLRRPAARTGSAPTTSAATCSRASSRARPRC